MKGVKMAAAAELNNARKKLTDAIGDNCKTYFANMKLWFRQKISKEDFDVEVRKLLSPEAVRLHNEFLLVVLNKCQSLTSTHTNKDSSGNSHSLMKDKLKKGKIKKKPRSVRATFEHRFRPANPLLFAPQVVSKEPADEERVVFCSREAILPALAMVHGRMFITAWDCGLDNVEDDAVKLMLYAVEYFLKNLITSVLSRRKAYRLREGHFKYALGMAVPDPYKQNAMQISDPAMESNATSISIHGDHVPSIKPTLDHAEAEAVFQLACSKNVTYSLPPVSLQDLFEALQIHQSVVQSHAVYAINMERMIAHFWHPSHEELDQESIHQQEIQLRQQLKAQQNALAATK